MKEFSEELPIYEVKSYDTTVEFTPLKSEAFKAFRVSKSPDTKLYVLDQATGIKRLLKKEDRAEQSFVKLSSIIPEVTKYKLRRK